MEVGDDVLLLIALVLLRSVHHTIVGLGRWGEVLNGTGRLKGVWPDGEASTRHIGRGTFLGSRIEADPTPG